MAFETDMGRPSDIEEALEVLPDQVADALEKWKKARVDKEREHARLFLSFKANSAGKDLTVEELKSMVKNDSGYYQICLDEITAESSYTRLYEKLMSAKKTASMRAAF